ncbi:MAG: hypothetical protein EBR09_14145 [Proteobacteria bacterium]|nr:hypothetical protein [Pseudomonadota bacterium]
MLPPKASEGDNAKQYTCATYHDMVVHDVTFSGLPAEQETVLKNMREKWVTQIKKVENEGPDLASATSNEVESPWRNYATEESFRMFIAQIFKPSCKDFFPALAPVCTEDPFTGVTCIPITDPEPAPTVSSCTSNLFPADPTKVVAGDPASEYPKVYTIKLSCEGIAAPDCYEVPINTPQNLHYMRQMTRERLRSFTRYNIVGNLSAMPSDILSCGSGTSGICAAKTEVQTALGTVADGLTLSTASLSPSNFLSSSSPFVKAQKKVDGALDVWKDFFAANDSANTSSPSTDLGANGVIADTDDFPFFKKLLNPINFLDLHSNFIVQDRAVTELPKPENMDLRRAFLKLPINNIIGLDEFSSFSLDSSSNPRPIFIDSWNTGSNVGGRFLRFWTTKNQLNSFLDAVPLESAYGDHFNPIDPNSFIVLFDKPTVDTATDTIAKIPTQTTLQKGDSGSIFTLDGIPMFALSTVNGEPTSGGAAVAAIPVAGPDTDDSLPSGGGSIAAGGGGGSPVASAGVACK